jgi:hypothetical protein
MTEHEAGTRISEFCRYAALCGSPEGVDGSSQFKAIPLKIVSALKLRAKHAGKTRLWRKDAVIKRPEGECNNAAASYL